MIRPVILAGPSGVGKTYISEILIKKHGFKKIVGTNTRKPRVGEVDGKDANFISVEKYLELRKQNRLFMDSFFLGNYYGYERIAVERIYFEGSTPLAIAYTPTVIDFLKVFPSGQSIFLMPVSIDILHERMTRRGDTPEEIKHRIASANNEIDEYLTNKNLFTSTILVKDDETSYILDSICKLRDSFC